MQFATPLEITQSLTAFSGLRSVPGVTFGCLSCLMYLGSSVRLFVPSSSSLHLAAETDKTRNVCLLSRAERHARWSPMQSLGYLVGWICRLFIRGRAARKAFSVFTPATRTTSNAASPRKIGSFSFTCTWSKNGHLSVLFSVISQSQKQICNLDHVLEYVLFSHRRTAKTPWSKSRHFRVRMYFFLALMGLRPEKRDCVGVGCTCTAAACKLVSRQGPRAHFAPAKTSRAVLPRV